MEKNALCCWIIGNNYYYVIFKSIYLSISFFQNIFFSLCDATTFSYHCSAVLTDPGAPLSLCACSCHLHLLFDGSRNEKWADTQQTVTGV